MSVVPSPRPVAPGQPGRRVIEVSAQDPRWDAFVLAGPDATVFHHSGWLTALAREYGQPPLRLACEEPDGTLSGILPLMATRGLPLGIGGASAGRRLSSLPRTPVAGPLAGPAGSPADHEAVLRDLVEAAMARAGPAGMRLQLKQAGRALDGVVPGLRGAPWRTTYVKSLPADPGQLRFGKSRNHARITWSVRKAQREGLCVRDAASEGDLREWYRLYLDVNRWRGLPSRPYRLFRAAWGSLRPGGFLRLLLVHQRRPGRERLVAGSMLLMLGETVFYAFNGRLRDALPLRPNDLLQWHAMRDAAADGYRWYDFGEVSEGNEGLAGFKAKWDTQARTLIRYHCPPLEHPRAGYAGPGGPAWPRTAVMAAWRQVPLPVTALAGDVVYRFL